MKLMFVSDIHGSAYYLNEVLKAYELENPDKLLLLGDTLYHGPRNPLPKDYDPKIVLSRLNEIKDNIIAVRGNCDSEVDQMVLEFPMMSDYTMLMLDGYQVFASHGHIHGFDNLPKLNESDVFIQGHTHIPVAKQENGLFLLNPGSVSLPKENYPNTYGIIDDNEFTIKTLDGQRYMSIKLKK